MGVRGLTSFIARNAELYLQPYELHDCNLVIDGDNLACNLYKDVTGTYSAFGGDYDDFYRAVLHFFYVLAECNVRAYVLMDGGYEHKKLRTVGTRLRGKIAVIKRINPCGSIPVFPLLMKEVFVDAVRDSGVPVMRCVFEADDELAALSRKLKCPVLSYDSDFYIHNVLYIPLITLTVKAHTKRFDEQENNAENEPRVKRKLRRNEAKNMEKRTKSNRILKDIQVDAVEKTAPRKGKTYKYMDCCIYRIEHLIARGSLSKEKLPLFAALLGNDYIARSSFKNFFASLGKSSRNRNRKLKQQQRRITAIMQWLKHENAQSALEKIMGRLKLYQRESLLAQVAAATSGYSNELCHSYDFFVANYENAFSEFVTESEDDMNNGDTSEDEVEAEISGEEDEELDEEEQLESNSDDDEGDQNEASGDESEVVDCDDDELDDEDAVESDNEDIESESEDNDNEEHSDADDTDKTKQFPPWFLQKLYPAHLSRFFVDLVHLKKYINSPQIEHFPYNDCHEIALPILVYIFTLLNNVQGAETKPRTDADGNQLPIEFTYLTRALRVTNIRYYRYAVEAPPSHPFDPSSPNPLLLRHVFTGTMHNLDAAYLFAQLEKLPVDIQLYFLSIVYWLQKSQHCDLLHLHSLLICLVVLRTIDSKIPAERDLKAFQKRFGKIIKKERLIRDKEAAEGVKRGVKEQLRSLPIPERMSFIPKSDCFLVQEHLLKHFHMQELFKKKYDHFSTIVLHGFGEFQSVVFQLHALNALLNFPLRGVRMGQSYCGVFLYNIYDLLRNRLDLRYYVENFIFKDSPMMLDFYGYLLDWCDQFVPHWKRVDPEVTLVVNKKVLKKQRQAERKKAVKDAKDLVDPNADMVDKDENDQEFFDLNNKFCTFLKIK